jgi:hydrogenase maturation protease
MTGPSILIAGVGNVFLGDDGFGVEVAKRLAMRPLPPQVAVRDFGIRGFDLTYSLLHNPDFVILVDTAQRGFPPGTIQVLEPEVTGFGGASPAEPETHGMIPTRAIEMARTMGAQIGKFRVVCCEPATFGPPNIGCDELSEPVAVAVDEAIRLIESLVEEHLHAPCTNSP